MEKDFSKHTVYGNFCSMDNRAFPIDCETLAALQSNAKKMAASALIAGCSRLILTGCKVSGSKRTEGYVFIVNADNPLTGEVIYHPEQTKADYCYIKEDPVLVEADGKKYPEAYDIRYIVDGRIDGAWAWSSFTNIADISNAALKEGLTGVKNDLTTKDSALRTLITQKETTLNNTIDTKESALNTTINNTKTGLEALIEQKTTSSSVAFVRGMIIMWSGSANNVPSGWALCNGEHGTPPLQNRFIVCAGSDYGVDSKGGAASQNITLSADNLPAHKHTFRTDDSGAHTHSVKDYFYPEKDLENSSFRVTYPSYFANKWGSGSSDTDNNTIRYAIHDTELAGTHGHNGTTNSTGSGTPFTFDNRPPYYALAFIMKL